MTYLIPDPSHKHRRADTNIVAVKFDMLVNPSHLHTGKPVFCSKCEAVFSVLSKVTPDGDGSQVSQNQAVICIS